MFEPVDQTTHYQTLLCWGNLGYDESGKGEVLLGNRLLTHFWATSDSTYIGRGGRIPPNAVMHMRPKKLG